MSAITKRSILGFGLPSERISVATGGQPSNRFSWDTVVEEIDPISQFRKAYEGWITNYKNFRTFEKGAFFEDTKNDLARRTHLGYLCNLISDAQLLAVTLQNDQRISEEDRERNLLDIDEFIKNLLVTLETWHSLHQPNEKENPLHAFA